MLDTRYSVMHPDGGKDSFFSAGKPKNLPRFYFLVLVVSFWWFLCSCGLI